MTECHHRRCCGCNRPAEIVAEVYSDDSLERFELCATHYELLKWEAARKGIAVITL